MQEDRAPARNGDLLAFVINFALVHFVDAEHALHQRGLASAVFAHQRMHGAGTKFELRIVQGLDPREGFDDAAHLQTVLTHKAASLG